MVNKTKLTEAKERFISNVEAYWNGNKTDEMINFIFEDAEKIALSSKKFKDIGLVEMYNIIKKSEI